MKRRSAGQQVVERAPEAIDVGTDVGSRASLICSGAM